MALVRVTTMPHRRGTAAMNPSHSVVCWLHTHIAVRFCDAVLESACASHHLPGALF